jgi:phosphatidate phosphatase APP1
MAETKPEADSGRALGALYDALLGIEHQWDRARFGVKRRFKRFRPLHVLPYRGLGTDRVVILVGRVTEDAEVRTASEHDSPWANLRRMIDRFETDEIPDATLRVRLGERQITTTTDHEGYFQFELSLPEDERLAPGWHAVDLELVRAPAPLSHAVQGRGEVLVPPRDCDFGVISDIDDTIVHTYVTDYFKMLQVTLLTNARTRLAVEGVAELYQALARGPGGVAAKNPIFYLSKSPWNIYDVLVEFMDRQGLPVGPLLLRDLGLQRRTATPKAVVTGFKLQRIVQLMELYSWMKFVLIGDSGEKDAQIYRDAARLFPGRVLAIYIRDVSGGKDVKRNDQVRRVADEVSSLGVDLMLIEHSAQAAEHARKKQLMA